MTTTTEETPERPDIDRDPMWHDAYMDVQKVLDEALGTEEEDGAGSGIAGDVWLLAHQRDEARAQVAQLAARLRDLTEPGLFPAAAPPRVNTHWAVAYGSNDVNDGIGLVAEYDDEEDAREHLEFYDGGSVVKRTVIALAWEAVPDQPREEPRPDGH